MDGAIGSVDRWFWSKLYCPKSVCWVAFSNDDDLSFFLYFDVVLCK